MYMNMCMIMTMNIYISPENEKHLRKEESMSGLINRLLGEYYSQERVTKKVRIETPAEKITSGATPKPKVLFESFGSSLCKHGADPAFCKHAKPGKECK